VRSLDVHRRAESRRDRGRPRRLAARAGASRVDAITALRYDASSWFAIPNIGQIVEMLPAR
jgi:hypothetical protein